MVWRFILYEFVCTLFFLKKKISCDIYISHEILKNGYTGTLSKIEPATFRFVAQCLNHCATACPQAFCQVCLFYQRRTEHWVDRKCVTESEDIQQYKCEYH
jgi:hypothetical protein